MKKTLKIEGETHRELTKILLAFYASNGKKRTYDEVINMLIDFWKKEKK